jgi:C-terminal processing protease CtpA/Prc
MMDISKIFTMVAVAVLAAMTASCGGSDSNDDSGFTTCSQADQNQRVFNHMRSWYYWNASLPNSIDPEAYTSVEDMIDDIAHPLDRYTFVIPEAQADSLFQNGQFIGVGITMRWVGNRLFVAEVWPGSPAGLEGMERGDEVLEIGGTPVASIDSLSDAFGDDEVGVQVTLRYNDVSAATILTPTLSKAVVTMDTVRFVDVFNVGGRIVGYLNFKTFVATSVQHLNDAFDTLQAAGVQDLVLDLRYNGGGFIYVAEQLASQIGGTTTVGQALISLVYNSNHQGSNYSSTFSNPGNALDLTRLVVITTDSTASASEMIINSLDPFIDVVTIGSTTYGKPVGSNAWDFCGQTLFPITFVTENAAGTADFFDGFPADCPAIDDLGHALSDPDEASLAEALFYIENGNCSVVAERSRMTLLERRGVDSRENRPDPAEVRTGGVH